VREHRPLKKTKARKQKPCSRKTFVPEQQKNWTSQSQRSTRTKRGKKKILAKKKSETGKRGEKEKRKAKLIQGFLFQERTGRGVQKSKRTSPQKKGKGQRGDTRRPGHTCPKKRNSPKKEKATREKHGQTKEGKTSGSSPPG